MTKKRKTVGILFGGKSAEHEVSINSAKAIIKNLDRDEFIPVLLYIDRKGFWMQVSEEDLVKDRFGSPVPQSFIPWSISTMPRLDVDIYFPVLHGPNGEDGKIQGLFEMSGMPYVGADSFSSALAMDKAVSKTLFQTAGLATPKFLIFQNQDSSLIRKIVEEELIFPIFVKPCSLGSSVGISKVNESSELTAALKLAFGFDRKIIVEQGIPAREIEISAMGNDHIRISRPGELIPANEFYDYQDKYVDGLTQFNIPAAVDKKTEELIKAMAIKAYQTLFLNGMSRIDFFIHKHSGEVMINEINTIPGFTEISMFPKLWQLDGLSFTDLISELIVLGFDFFRTKSAAHSHHDE